MQKRVRSDSRAILRWIVGGVEKIEDGKAEKRFGAKLRENSVESITVFWAGGDGKTEGCTGAKRGRGTGASFWR